MDDESVILLEEMIYAILSERGIQASIEELDDQKGPYVLFSRTGGNNGPGNSLTGWSGRPSIGVDFIVYADDELSALRLASRVAKICWTLESYSRVSGVTTTQPSRYPGFNNQRAYSFSLQATVLETEEE